MNVDCDFDQFGNSSSSITRPKPTPQEDFEGALREHQKNLLENTKAQEALMIATRAAAYAASHLASSQNDLNKAILLLPLNRRQNEI